MAYVEYATRINAPIDKVWKVMTDLSNPAIGAGIASRTEMEGLRVGARLRAERVPERGGGWYEEVLTEVDPARHRVSWTITDAGPIPVTDYSCTMQLTRAGESACHVGFEARFKPVDVPAALVEAGFMSGWIKFCENARAILGV